MRHDVPQGSHLKLVVDHPPALDVPAELRARIAEAEAAARGLLDAARPLGELSRRLGRELEALGRARGLDDRAFDRLSSVTDELSRLQHEVAVAATGYGDWP